MKDKVSLQTKLSLLATALLSFCGVLVETSMNVTFPELSQLFNVSLGSIQWITTGYLLTVTIIMGTTAFAFKKFPIKNIFILAISAFLIGDILAIIAPSFVVLLIARIIQAVATGLAMPMMYQVVFTQIPESKIGLYAGITAMVISLAPALGPTYGGILSSLLSWQYIYILVLPLIVISFFIGIKVIDIQPRGNAKRFDYPSLILLALALITLVWSTSQFGISGSSNLVKYGSIIIGLIFLFGFIKLNNHGESEVLNVKILKKPEVALNAINYFILMFINIGISFVIPIYAESVLGLSPMIAGLVLLPGSLIGGVMAPVAGMIYDRYGAFVPITTGLVIVIIGTSLFAHLQDFYTAFLMLVFFAIVRFGFNLAFSNTISNATANVDKKNTSDVNSIFNMIQQFAGSIGTSILAAIIAFHQNQVIEGVSKVAKTYAGGHVDYLLLSIIATIALIIAIINWNLQRKNKIKA
ncbi:MFS transporter [Lactobacillus sp. S2-2]|uniref:MFS transporter n=1 Tax=Lactobacillus sp. S2-2 TaxID=2692917 RepID=UPI001F027CDF|nr:MFS transporter [Lactobacillus sp. S2-2]MCF6514642.1 MFS transporter [Lactobacillus sp. S2-2]